MFQDNVLKDYTLFINHYEHTHMYILKANAT